jgi:DNA-binding MarR family transcriptional regulator
MEKEILKKQKQLTKEGYVVVPNYFLRERVKVLGIGPSMLYLYLLTYCHKGKDIAWPTISTLSKKMNLTPKTITKYRQKLVKYGLIKKVSKRKTYSGSHMRNIYQLTPFDMEKNIISIGNISTYLEGKSTPDIRENLPTNNNNVNNINATTKRKKDAVVAVNFKKLKEKGEEKVLAIKEQLLDLDFKESFIEKLLKNYSSNKIEEKIELLKFKRNIQNPAGWLSAALKYDYKDNVEKESQEEEPVRQASRLSRIDFCFHGNNIGWSGNDKSRGLIH